MGRYYFFKKEEADELKKVEIWRLKKHGYLEKGLWKSGEIKWANRWTGNKSSVGFYSCLYEDGQYIQFHYTRTNNGGEKENLDYKIPLITTPCFFGGIRYWFKCTWYVNGNYCGRRVGVLYLGGKYFACRHCYNLSYESRNENRRDKDFALFYIMMGYKKADELKEKIKRSCYAGKPTRKQRVLERVYQRMFPYTMVVQEKEELEKKLYKDV